LTTSTQLPPEVRKVVTDVVEDGARTEPPRRRRRRRAGQDSADRGILSISDRRKRGVRWGSRTVNAVLLVVLLIVGLGPLLWLAKSAITPTQDTLATPMALWPHGVDWANLSTAWSTVHIDVQFMNTIWVAAGSWAMQVLVATTGGYALSVLRRSTGKCSTGSSSARCSCPPWCCSCRCTSPS
jgi:ABC-type sugar transport system, permease component